MDHKYTLLRGDLQAARSRLDDDIRSDRQLAYILDHAIEVVEHLEFRRENNVIEFPCRHDSNTFNLDRVPRS